MLQSLAKIRLTLTAVSQCLSHVQVIWWRVQFLTHCKGYIFTHTCKDKHSHTCVVLVHFIETRSPCILEASPRTRLINWATKLHRYWLACDKRDESRGRPSFTQELQLKEREGKEMKHVYVYTCSETTNGQGTVHICIFLSEPTNPPSVVMADSHWRCLILKSSLWDKKCFQIHTCIHDYCKAYIYIHRYMYMYMKRNKARQNTTT